MYKNHNLKMTSPQFNPVIFKVLYLYTPTYIPPPLDLSPPYIIYDVFTNDYTFYQEPLHEITTD